MLTHGAGIGGSTCAPFDVRGHRCVELQQHTRAGRSVHHKSRRLPTGLRRGRLRLDDEQREHPRRVFVPAPRPRREQSQPSGVLRHRRAYDRRLRSSDGPGPNVRNDRVSINTARRSGAASTTGPGPKHFQNGVPAQALRACSASINAQNSTSLKMGSSTSTSITKPENSPRSLRAFVAWRGPHVSPCRRVVFRMSGTFVCTPRMEEQTRMPPTSVRGGTPRLALHRAYSGHPRTESS